MDLQLILFDFDGTLVASGEGLVRSLSYAMDALGIREPDKKKLERFIGPPLNLGFRQWYHMNDDQIQEALSLFRQRYDKKGIYEAHVYPGIRTVLDQGKEAGIPMVVASAKPAYYLEKMIKHFDLSSYFARVQGPGLQDELENKAGDDVKERMIRAVLEHYPDTERDRIVMIGDRPSDISAAKLYGLKTIGVSYGYGTKEEIRATEPDHLAQSTEELSGILFG
ncbi:MAG: HAD hydrolase-like protein [Erysipelotrichaceae bacterium]|nr:HAD hydrolase-like protein [Erysipelotrichaceae bacterium]